MRRYLSRRFEREREVMSVQFGNSRYFLQAQIVVQMSIDIFDDPP